MAETFESMVIRVAAQGLRVAGSLRQAVDDFVIGVEQSYKSSASAGGAAPAAGQTPGSGAAAQGLDSGAQRMLEDLRVIERLEQEQRLSSDAARSARRALLGLAP